MIRTWPTGTTLIDRPPCQPGLAKLDDNLISSTFTANGVDNMDNLPIFYQYLRWYKAAGGFV
jgi:hypothetical protein